MTARLPDWEQRLGDYLAGAMHEPHAFGSNDCLLFPAGVVRALTGKDHGRKHRGKYRSQATAYRHLQSLGFSNPEQFLDSIFEETPVGFAQRGDLVLASDGIPAVCMGSFALSVGQEGNVEGLVRVPRSDWVKAWRVG